MTLCERPSFVLPEMLAQGTFKKGNEPGEMAFPILVKYCACGLNMLARIPHGKVWVIAEEL